MARRLIKTLYWKVISVLARMSRSIRAMNEGVAPQGSVATGPHQPLSALRDAVAMLGASTGRLEARLGSISLNATGIIDRLIYSLVIAEVSTTPPGTKVGLVGDFIVVRLAADLADLSYDVTVYDTIETAGLELSPWVKRKPIEQASAGEIGEVLVVASSAPFDRLRDESRAAVETLVTDNAESRLVSCAPDQLLEQTSGAVHWRREASALHTSTRRVNATGHTQDARRVTSVTIASQLSG